MLRGRPARPTLLTILLANRLLRRRLASITAWSPRRMPDAMRMRRATAAVSATASTANAARRTLDLVRGPPPVIDVKLIAALLDLKHSLPQALGGRVHQTLGPFLDQESGDRHG